MVIGVRGVSVEVNFNSSFIEIANITSYKMINTNKCITFMCIHFLGGGGCGGR